MSDLRLRAMRVELDRGRPCLACGAPWRVVSESSDILDSSDPQVKHVVVWEPKRGNCSADCWREDAIAYDIGLIERDARGWRL